MTDDLVELHGTSGRHFAQLTHGVGPDQWRADTPCSEWDVRALVHHLLYEQRWVGPLLEGRTIAEVGDTFDGDLLGPDAATWAQTLSSSVDDAQRAVAVPGALERTVHLSFGDNPGREYVMQLTADLAVHGWDLARATGQDEAMDPDVVALLLPWSLAHAELLSASGLFGSPVDPGSDATDQARLLGLMGRPL